MKNFSERKFLKASVVMALLCLACFALTFAHNHGMIKYTILLAFALKLYLILRFPMVMIFGYLFGEGMIIELIGLLSNSIIYGIGIERVLAYLKYRKKPNSVTGRRPRRSRR